MIALELLVLPTVSMLAVLVVGVAVLLRLPPKRGLE